METVKKSTEKYKGKNSFVINFDLKMSVDASSLSDNFTPLVRRRRRKYGREGGRTRGWKEGHTQRRCREGRKYFKNLGNTGNVYLEESH